ncbi:MAG: class I SAM-dependent rRNA methyltransferase [Pseudomonadota bacterium]
MTDLPKLVLARGRDRRLRSGSPWVFANEVEMTAEAKALPAGSLVALTLADGRVYGVAHFNSHSLIVARLLTRNLETPIDAAFFRRRLERALALRARTVDVAYCRLVNAEGDLLPGLVVDRYGDVVVVQPNSAGMAASVEPIVDAVRGALAPRAIVVRRDSHARVLEGVGHEPAYVEGELSAPVPVVEAGVTFRADPVNGQKTGWFFDQQPNRTLVAGLAQGASVLDLYSYTGGFGIRAAAAGARHVHAVDRSAPALDLLRESVAGAGLGAVVEATQGEVLEVLGGLTSAKQRFDVVIADPPPFAPAKKDVPVALKGYRKVARAAAGVTGQDGFLGISSCSHHVDADALLQASVQGVRDAGRLARLVFSGGAGPDHPIHPALPESRYLSFLLFALD